MVQCDIPDIEARELHEMEGGGMTNQNKHNRNVNFLLTDVNSHQIHKSSKICLAWPWKCSNTAGWGELKPKSHGLCLQKFTRKPSLLTLGHLGAYEIIMWFHLKQCNFLTPWFLFKGEKKPHYRKIERASFWLENVRDRGICICRYTYTHTHKRNYFRVFIIFNIYCT